MWNNTVLGGNNLKGGITVNKILLKYRAYLLRQLFREIDDMIDIKVLSYEEYCKSLIEKNSQLMYNTGNIIREGGRDEQN